jgi:hypothetical protein
MGLPRCGGAFCEGVQATCWRYQQGIVPSSLFPLILTYTIQTVVDFKESSEQISKNCKTISESLLVKIKKKRMYKGMEFAKKQEEYRLVMQAKLLKAHHEIKDIMNKVLFSFFSVNMAGILLILHVDIRSL